MDEALPPPHRVTMPDYLVKVLFDGQVAEKPLSTW